MQPVPEEAGALAGPAPRRPLTLASGRGNLADRVYGYALLAMGMVIPLLLAFLLFRVGASALPALREFGWGFLASSEWNPVEGQFGALPFIFGTLASSLLALLIAVPLAVGLAIFLTELAPRWIAAPVAFGTELLAAIPSVVYGLWGIFVLVPWLRSAIQEPLASTLGDSIPLFRGPAYGVSILSAGVILAIMVIPFISAVSREVLAAVPRVQREGALALGATRWEMTWQVVLPYATPGIIGATILGLGRALGETMAVTMVIGNRPEITASLFSPGYTMASVLANEFAEASTDLYLAALMEVALILFGITIVVNTFARLLVWRVARRGGR
ncbi:MAG TPA: phosphate ABC transporter permease subunit PstC [Longimicrobiaceae bacterium]|jgi:phosphate transport system permease protein|nr:phosphate ABC transporter permease subunit PstC [Longimicrobiaceae bacterium]